VSFQASRNRQARALWVSLRVIPHEPQVRAWLRRARIQETEADEIVQEAYCRLAGLPAVDHIDQPGAYFFSIARNLLARRLRRADVVSLETIAEIEAIDPSPDPETRVAGKMMFERLEALIEELPERCRRIIRLRKFQGYSQKEIAAMLGITESIVENQVQYGIRHLLRAWAMAETDAADRLGIFERGSNGHQ
jgi:RNA polymerase sigma factor (sigma-70 family)